MPAADSLKPMKSLQSQEQIATITEYKI